MQITRNNSMGKILETEEDLVALFEVLTSVLLICVLASPDTSGVNASHEFIVLLDNFGSRQSLGSDRGPQLNLELELLFLLLKLD